MRTALGFTSTCSARLATSSNMALTLSVCSNGYVTCRHPRQAAPSRVDEITHLVGSRERRRMPSSSQVPAQDVSSLSCNIHHLPTNPSGSSRSTCLRRRTWSFAASWSASSWPQERGAATTALGRYALRVSHNSSCRHRALRQPRRCVRMLASRGGTHLPPEATRKHAAAVVVEKRKVGQAAWARAEHLCTVKPRQILDADLRG